jgi:hypothetical protein
MDVVEYLKQGGKCRSKSGHDFILDSIKYEEYPIRGWLLMGKFYYPCKWTENGEPHNLPYTHSLDLVPVIPITTYKMVNKKLLSECDNIEDFYDKAYS